MKVLRSFASRKTESGEIELTKCRVQIFSRRELKI